MLISLLLGTVDASMFGVQQRGQENSPDFRKVDTGASVSDTAVSGARLDTPVARGITDLESFRSFVLTNKLQAHGKAYALSHSAVEGAKNDAVDQALDEMRVQYQGIWEALSSAVEAAFPNGSKEFSEAIKKSPNENLRKSKLAEMVQPKLKLAPEEIQRLKDVAAQTRTALEDAERPISKNLTALWQLLQDNELDSESTFDSRAVETLKSNNSSLLLDDSVKHGDARAKKSFRDKQVDLFLDFLAKRKLAAEAEAAAEAADPTPEGGAERSRRV